MGGKLMQQYGGIRLTNDDFVRVKSEIQQKLDSLGVIHAIAPFIGEKETHGDLDVIVCNRSGDRLACREIFKQHQPYLPNGEVDSFAYRMENGAIFQVDLIFMDEEHFDFSVKYFSYNDLGNLYGRYAHKMGLKFGHDGLKMPLRDGTDLFATLVLTTDFRKAVEFLGFSYEAFERGFKTFEQLYKYVSNHDRFTPKMFDLTERNHTARMRDKKRPTYTGFTTWVDKNRGYLGDYAWPEDKSRWLPDIFSVFPAEKIEYDRLWEERRRRLDAKAKINGNHVMQLTGLEGKTLGRLLESFREKHPDWVEYAIACDQETLDQEMMSLAETLALSEKD